MSLNRDRKSNYNLVTFLCIGIFVAGIINIFLAVILNIMFYKANFNINNSSNNNNTQIVNIDNTKKYDKININECSFEALDSLRGIGEVKANKIIENRPYNDIYELRKIIGETTFNNTKDYITI